MVSYPNISILTIGEIPMQSIPLSRSEDNTHKEKEVFNNLLDEVNTFYVDISSDESLSLDDVEVRVSEAFRSFVQKF